jgi:hypothetical protein
MNPNFEMSIADLYARVIVIERMASVVIANALRGLPDAEKDRTLADFARTFANADLLGLAPEAETALRARLAVTTDRVCGNLREMIRAITSSGPSG